MVGTRTLSKSVNRKPMGLVIGSSASRGFTLVDVLVSIAVIGVLMSLLLPALAMVRETTRKVVCSSNVRQVGLGLVMYADMHREQLPYAIRSGSATQRNPVPGPVAAPLPSQMMTLRTESVADGWDGLGRLYEGQFSGAPGVFYCPSHNGDHPYNRYAETWNKTQGELIGNYHYRSEAARPRTLLRSFKPEDALVTDGLRTRRDFNHRTGSNVLIASLAVVWYVDAGGRVFNSLPTVNAPETAAMADDAITEAFQVMGGEDVTTFSRPG